jgi:hypothetical protein
VLERNILYSTPLHSSAFLEQIQETALDPTPVHPLMMPEWSEQSILSQSIIETSIAPVPNLNLFGITAPSTDIPSDVQQILQTFFAQSDWRNQLSTDISWSFQTSWIAISVAQGNFDVLPPIQVVPADTLGDKPVAFDWLTGTISLSSDFMTENANNPAEIANTVLEAISAQTSYSHNSNHLWGESHVWFRPIQGWGSSHWRPFNSFWASDEGTMSVLSPQRLPYLGSLHAFLLGQSATPSTPLNAAEQVMQSFFSQPNWTSQLPLSTWNQSSLWMMPYRFSTGNFRGFPQLQVMTGNELQGQALAYDVNTNSIQVSNWFLEANQDNSATIVREILNLNLHIKRGTLDYYAPPMGSETWALDSAIADAQTQLATFVSQPDWVEKIKPAFGSTLNVDAANAIAQLIVSGAFDFASQVEVVPASALNGLNSVYDINSSVFYISEEFINANAHQPEVITSALIEEFGHYLDIQVNPTDSPGDEGQIFAAIVQGTTLSISDWNTLLTVDDSLPPVIDLYRPLLEPAYVEVQTTLNTLFSQPNWVDQIIPIFGSEIDQSIANAIAQFFLSGQLTVQSLVKVVPAQTMAGLDSVFDTTTNTIYLSQEFIDRNVNQPEVLTRALLEAFGHYLDSQINNGTDAQGDEGQMFAAIAQDSLISAADWYAMRGEDDLLTIALDGEDRPVEVSV